jgi:lauroyl/myristoyl acyltransferase
MSEGTFKLSLRTGAPIIPFFSSYDNGTGIRVYIGKPIIADNIQKAADTLIKEFETFILKYPQDWSGWIRLDMENDKEGAYFRLLKDKLLW